MLDGSSRTSNGNGPREMVGGVNRRPKMEPFKREYESV